MHCVLPAVEALVLMTEQYPSLCQKTHGRFLACMVKALLLSSRYLVQLRVVYITTDDHDAARQSRGRAPRQVQP